MRGFRGFYSRSLMGVVLLYVSMTLAGCSMGSMGGGGDPVGQSASGVGIFSTDSIYDINEAFNKGITKLTYRIIPALSAELSSERGYVFALTGIVKVYKVDASHVLVFAKGGSGRCLNCYGKILLADIQGGIIGRGIFKLEKGVIVDIEKANGWEVMLMPPGGDLDSDFNIDTTKIKMGGFINRCAFSLFLYNLEPHYIYCFTDPCPQPAIYLTMSALNEECLKEFEDQAGHE